MIGDLFNLLLLQPTINLLALIVRLLENFSIPGGLGFAIIVLTIIIKVVTWPFTSSQLKHSKKLSEKMAELKPHLDRLKEQYREDKLGFGKAQGELFKQHGISPAAGCLPSLVPLIVIFPLYQAIEAFLNGSKGLERINYFLYQSSWKVIQLPDPNFFIFNLADKPADFLKVGPAVLLVPIITALLTFIQSKMMSPTPVKKYPSDSTKEKHEKEKGEETLSMFQNQMVTTMPIVFGFVAFSFPIGLSIYITTLTLMGIYQQYLISGWGGIEGLKRRLTGG